MVSKTYSSASSFESTYSRSRSSAKYGSHHVPDPAPRSRSTVTSTSSTKYEGYTSRARSSSAYGYGSSTYDSSSSYTSKSASGYTPGSYTSKRSRSTATKYESATPRAEYSFQYSTSLNRYPGQVSVTRDDTAYRSSGATVVLPRRRYSLSVDRDVSRVLASDPGYVSQRGAAGDSSVAGDSFVLGYASVKTRSDPDEPIPHAYIAAPRFGHAKITVQHENKPRPKPVAEPVTVPPLTPVTLSQYVPPKPIPKPVPKASIPSRPQSRKEYDFSYNTYGFELGRGHERLDVDGLDITPQRGRPRTRAASISRQFLVNGDLDTRLARTRVRSRAASLSRYSRAGLEIEDSVITVPRRRSASISRFHGIDHEVALPTKSYGIGFRRHHVLQDLKRAGGSDISHVVLEPGARFEPSSISMVVLPSGQKAVTYEHVSQYGKGDHREANIRIEDIIMRTKHLQESMHTLENFVKANRSLFPEETLIYQHLVFFQLNEAQLRKIGANPDAVVYGIKMKERLVVPYGTDVTKILNKYYGKKSQYEVEFRDRGKIREGMMLEQDRQLSLKDRIRKQVEEEWDLEHQRFLAEAAAKKKSLAVQELEDHVPRPEVHKHTYTHFTPDFIRSFHVDAGLDYDSIYSQRSIGSALSDQDSTITKSSLASSRKKRLDAAPQFMSKLRPKRCTEGQTIRLNCSVQGLPLPEISWYRGNHLVNEGGRYHISNNYGLLSLEITDVTKDDHGLYTVRAVNAEGEAVCSAPLEVQELAPDQERLGITTKPYFLMDVQNVWAEVGQKAVFEAQATGKPMPSFTWQKDNINITTDDKYKVFSDERGNTKLVIKNIIEADMGLYLCVAENREGKQKSAGTLRVVDKGQLIDGEKPSAIRRRSLSREATPVFDIQSVNAARLVGGTKPYFIQVPPSEMTATSGDPVTMRCVVDGEPKPVVKWYKGARELNYTNRHRVLVEGDHHIMQIRAVLQTDPGEYVIVAENPLGRAKTSVWLSVTPRTDLDEEDIEALRKRLDFPDFEEYELEFTKEQGKMAPRFVKRLPLEKEVKEGESLQIGCKIEEMHVPEYVVGVELKTKTEEITKEAKPVVSEAAKEPEKVPEPVVSIAETVAAAVVTTAVAEATAVVVEKGSAPVIEAPLKNSTVKAGSILKLTVVIKGAKPAPSVRWFKDDIDVTENDHYEIFAEEDSYNLEVVDVEVKDAGLYCVVATNESGSVSSDCIIKVEEIKAELPKEEVSAETVLKVSAEAVTENVSEEVKGVVEAETVAEVTEKVQVVAETEETAEAVITLETTVTEAMAEETAQTVETSIKVEEESAETTLVVTQEEPAEVVTAEEEMVVEKKVEVEKVAVVGEKVVEETVAAKAEETKVEEKLVEEKISLEKEVTAEEAPKEPVKEEMKVEEKKSPEKEEPVKEEIKVEEKKSPEKEEPVKEEIKVEEKKSPEKEEPVKEEIKVEEKKSPEKEEPVKEEIKVEEKKSPEKEEPVKEEIKVEEKKSPEKEVTAEEAPKEPVKEEMKVEKKKSPEKEEPVKEEKKKKKKKKEKEEVSEESAVEEKPSEEEKPKDEKKKKKKKDKSEEEASGEEAGKEEKKKKTKKEKPEEEVSVEEVAKEEKKKKKKKDKEAKAEEEVSAEEITKEKAKKKTKEQKSEEETSAVEEVTKEEKKKKKKKDKAQEPSEDEVTKEEAAKAEKKKKKKKDEAVDSGEKSPDESAKEERKKKKKSKEVKAEEMETEALIKAEAAVSVESSSATVITEGAVTTESISSEAVVESSEVSEETVTVTQTAAGSTSETVVEVSMESTLAGEIGAGDSVMEAEASEETVTLEVGAGGSEVAEVSMEAETEITLTAGTAETEVTVASAAAETEVTLVAESAEEEVTLSAEAEASQRAAQMEIVTGESSDITLDMSSSVEQSMEMEGRTIIIEGQQAVQAATLTSTEGEMDATITIVSDSAEAEADQTVEMTTETIVLDSGSSKQYEVWYGEEGQAGGEELMSATVTLDRPESGGEVSKTQTKTITTSADGETTVEVRTVTQTRVVEVVEGEAEEMEGEFTMEAASPPQLETPLRGCVVKVGETARLQCKINCDVALEITWTKDGQTLTDTDRLKIFTEGESVFVLTISSAQKSDEGDYTIIASSSGGVIQLTANIIVIDTDQEFEIVTESEEEDEEEDEEDEGGEEKEDKEDKEQGSEEGSEEDSEEESEESEENEAEEVENVPVDDVETKVSSLFSSSIIGGFLTQAMKIGELMINDYIM